MNQNIRNPEAYIHRLVERRQRRERPKYPTLPSGRAALVERTECGITRHFLPFDSKLGCSPTRELTKRFVFARASAPISRSRYTPHVGRKQMCKMLASLV